MPGLTRPCSNQTTAHRGVYRREFAVRGYRFVQNEPSMANAIPEPIQARQAGMSHPRSLSQRAANPTEPKSGPNSSTERTKARQGPKDAISRLRVMESLAYTSLTAPSFP